MLTNDDSGSFVRGCNPSRNVIAADEPRALTLSVTIVLARSSSAHMGAGQAGPAPRSWVVSSATVPSASVEVWLG